MFPEMNKLVLEHTTRKDKVHIEAYNMYFQVRNFCNLYQRF